MNLREITDIVQYYCNAFELPMIEIKYRPYRGIHGQYYYRVYGVISSTGIKITRQLKFNQTFFEDDDKRIRYFSTSIEARYAVVIHEVCHYIAHTLHNETTHGKIFRQLEITLLSDFGLRPVGYKRAYYTTVKAAMSNRNFGGF